MTPFGEHNAMEQRLGEKIAIVTGQTLNADGGLEMNRLNVQQKAWAFKTFAKIRFAMQI